ncbi:hypothetical protein PFISCL1PPCAC_12752, partial [Pristionchus fissidentatus]
TLDRAAIDDTELHAIFALLVCDADVASGDLSESTMTALDDIRTEVLHDLHWYYTRQLGLAEYSTRLGHIMILCFALEECSALFREQFRMQAALFDLVTAESMLKELIL